MFCLKMLFKNLWFLLLGPALRLYLLSPFLHRKQQDAQAGAGLQESHHGRQCHLVPASRPQGEPASAALCLSLPIPPQHRAMGEAGGTQPRPKSSANPRRKQPGWASRCLAAPGEVPSPPGPLLFCLPRQAEQVEKKKKEVFFNDKEVSSAPIFGFATWNDWVCSTPPFRARRLGCVKATPLHPGPYCKYRPGCAERWQGNKNSDRETVLMPEAAELAIRVLSREASE